MQQRSGAASSAGPRAVWLARKAIALSRRRLAADQGAADMPLAHRLRATTRHREDEARLGVAGAERADPLDMPTSSGVAAARRERRIDAELTDRRRRRRVRAETLGEEARELRQRLARTVRPAAMAWPPPLTSSPAWRAAITAAPRSTPGTERPEPLPTLAVEADHEGRPVEALVQPAGDDADHAGMPALARDDQRRRRQPRPACASTCAMRVRRAPPRSMSRRSALSASSRAASAPRLVRVVGRQQPRAEIGLRRPGRRH